MLAIALGMMRIAGGVFFGVFLGRVRIPCGTIGCPCGVGLGASFVAMFAFGNARRGPLGNRKDCQQQTDDRMKYGRSHEGVRAA